MEVTRLLQEWAAGDRQALDRLMPLVYEELRHLAHQRLRGERPDHTLGTTALVHEAYLRLVDIHRAGFRSRAHFLAMASRAMRRVLVDHARRHAAEKRGGGVRPLALDDIPGPAADDERIFRVLVLDEALERLATIDDRHARILEQHYFGGLTVVDIAEAMDISQATVKRDLRAARAWLASELGDQAGA